MVTRVGFIVRYYINLVVIFLLQKPLFILFTKEDRVVQLSDYLRVMWAGLPMDLSVAGYLTALPLLIALIGAWWPLAPNFNVKKILFPYHILISILLALIFIVDISLYHFWQYKLDSSIFVFINSPKGMAAGVSMGYIIFRALVVIVVARLLYVRLKFLSPNTFNPEEKAPKRRICCSFILIILGGLIFIGIRGGVKESTMNVGRVYFSDNVYLNHSAVNPAFSLFSSIGKNKNFKKQYSFMESSRAKAIVDSLYTNNGASVNQAFPVKKLLKSARPNILVIVMESFGSTFTKATYGAKNEPVTPNFQKEASSGILFKNFYCNSYRTDRGLVSTFSGYPALPNGSLMKMPKVVEHLPSLATELVKAGYKSSFLYGGDINFTNTKGYLKRGGFENLTADVDFSLRERHSNEWGVNDEFTFNFLLNQISRQSSDTKYFMGFLTLSSHEPFDVPLKKIEDKVYNAACYSDSCLGNFLTALRKTPQWANLLIVILPDHNMLYNTTYTASDYFHCSMLWTGGAIAKAQTIETLINQSDMAATLLGQLNLNHASFPFSRDIFSPDYTAHSVFCSYNNAFMVADSTGATFYDLPSKKIQGAFSASALKRAEGGKALLQQMGDKINDFNN